MPGAASPLHQSLVPAPAPSRKTAVVPSVGVDVGRASSAQAASAAGDGEDGTPHRLSVLHQAVCGWEGACASHEPLIQSASQGCQSSTTGLSKATEVHAQMTTGRPWVIGGLPGNLQRFPGVTEEPAMALLSLTIPPRPEFAAADCTPPSAGQAFQDHLDARSSISEVCRHDA
jgi:hypothetical protein